MSKPDDFDSRFPRVSEIKKVITFIIGTALVISFAAEQWNTWWFWPLLLFGGGYCLDGVHDLMRVHFAREGYNAGVEDCGRLVSRYHLELFSKGSPFANEMLLRIGSDFSELRRPF